MADSPLRFLKIDYQSQRDAIIDRIKSRWPLVWNDYLSNNFGIIVVDLIAWVLSTFAYTVNRLAGENFIDTMTLRESAVRVGKLVGYKLKGALPATLLCQASIPSPAVQDITIRQGTIVRSNDGNNLPYEVEQDYAIYTGNTTPVNIVLEISPDSQDALSGVIRTGIAVSANSTYLDLLDPTADLSSIITSGQTFQALNDTTQYLVRGYSTAPGAVNNNRIVLTDPWQGGTGIITGTIFDNRIALTQGQTITDTFTSPSTDSPRFRVTLSRASVIDGSVKVQVNTNFWTEIDQISSADSQDTVFEVFTQQGVTYVQFGDGNIGEMVPPQSNITVTYRIGGGSVGNLPAGSVNTSVIGTTITNTPISVALYNATPGSGGQDQETLEEARINIPLFTKTQDRCVTYEDYAALATAFSDPTRGRVKYARTTVRVQNSLLEGNVVVIYCWAQANNGNLTPLAPDLKSALKDFLQTKAVGTDYVVISDGSSRPLPLIVRFKAKDGYDPRQVTPFLQDTINQIIARTPPGNAIGFSDLVTELQGSYGVESLQIATPVDDISPLTTDEVFTSPDESYQYDIDLSSISGTNYSGIIPVIPLSPWGIQATVNGAQVSVLPDLEPGYALLVGASLNAVRFGLLANIPSALVATNTYYLATDQSGGVLYLALNGVWVQQPAGSAFRSRINLRTGDVQLSGNVPLTSFSVSLLPVSGYSRVRQVNVYLGYTGTDLSADKRNQIRSAIKSYFEGIQAGGTVFARATGTSYDISASNIQDVVRNISGVASVPRVSLETPTNSSNRVDSTDFELLKVGSIVINNDVT